MLTPGQIEQYAEQGYLVLPALIPPDKLAAIRAATDRLVDGARGVVANDDLYDLEPGHTPTLPRVRRLKPAIFSREPIFSALIRDPLILEPVSQLLGTGVRLHGGKLNLKAAGYGSPVEWHQDWAFYPHSNDDVLATGLYLDDCDLANGPLLVMPGTHRGSIYDHHSDGRFCGAMDPVASGLDFNQAVPLTGPAGSLTIHHARLVHGSALNTSNRTRRLLLHEYAATDAWPLMGVKDLAEFDSRIVLGAPTLEPRVRPAPIRMPLPAAEHQGSIYENQRGAGRLYFQTAQARSIAKM